MKQHSVKLVETDALLTEEKKSLKKKIFNLSKMESLVFSDPKLTVVYDEMAKNGEEKYGYHYNETIMNIIFNDYVLNSPKYLQKYKMAIPKKKERRDKSGIYQLKKSGEEKMSQTGLPKPPSQSEKTLSSNGVNETTSANSAGGAAGYVGYAGHAAWGSGDLMKTGGKSKAMRKPIWKMGTIVGESNYLTDPSGFEKYVEKLNEQSDINFIRKNSEAYGSLDKMNHQNRKLIKQDIKTGIIDGPNMSEQESLRKIFTPEELKVYVREKRARGEKGLVKSDIPLLAGQALYNVAINMANKLLPMRWDDLPDINSMWDYIDKNGGMSYEDLIRAVKEAVDDRLSEEGFSLDDLEEGRVNEKATSKAQQRLFGMARAIQKGELNPKKVGGSVVKIAKTVSPKDVEDFASTKHEDLPEKVDEYDKPEYRWREEVDVNEDMQTKIQSNGSFMSNKSTTIDDQSSNVDMGIKSTKLLEELNNELNAFSIHHNKLKKMGEGRKSSALVLKDRLGNENEKNFKSDLQNSGTKEIIDVIKELQWKDQQTDVKDAQKLGRDIEKKEVKVTDAEGKEHLKNVGDSTNDKGDEIPKRNSTAEEQYEIDMYRNGQHSWVYDNKPDKRFENRIKLDMGEDIYKMRQEQLKFKGKAPMYNKDSQPVEDTTSDKVQFNKEQTGWSERVGLKEGIISAKYVDVLGKTKFVEFNLKDVIEISEVTHLDVTPLNLKGMGNIYLNKVKLNENLSKVINEWNFYIFNGNIVAHKPIQNLNETKLKDDKPVISEQIEKIKHLSSYKPNDFVDTKNIKKNRGF